MARIDTTKGNGGKAFELLETDIYRMVIKAAEIEADQFAEPDENGNLPDKLKLTWEVYEATPEQDASVVGQAVWQRMAPWYGSGKRGDSQFKLLIDSLIDQEILDGFDPEDFDTDVLVGIKQRVNVEQYKKTMGTNIGQPGNRIVGKPMPLVSRRKPAPPAAPRPVAVPARQPGRSAPRVRSDEVFEEEAAGTY